MSHFIVDFYCASGKLIVEVDGGVHALQQDADTNRQEFLEDADFRVIRLTSEEVEQDLDAALSKIRSALLGDVPSHRSRAP